MSGASRRPRRAPRRWPRRSPTLTRARSVDSINFLMYTRASASDYDDWNTEGWSFNDILPLARKMETCHLPEGQNPKVHGKDGPLHVSYGGHQSALGKEFIQATADSNYEIPFKHDIQDFKTGHGITNWGKVRFELGPFRRGLADRFQQTVDRPEDWPPSRHGALLRPPRRRIAVQPPRPLRAEGHPRHL